MRYAVVGAGAIGGYYGGLLSQVADVTFLARGTALATLQTRGLDLIEADARQRLRVPVAASAEQVGPVDVVIVATKALGLRDALATVQPLVDAGAMVMPVQNGVEAPHIVAEFAPEAQILPCIVRGFLELVAPATVAYHGGPRSFTFGTWTGSPAPVLQGIADDIHAAGFDGIVLDDIRIDLWQKAMFVVPFGALGAVSAQPLGVLRNDLREQFERTIAEVHRVGVAMGVPLAPETVAATLAFADAMPADATTSMQRDILAGLPSELDSQVGGIVRLAKRLGVDVPLLEMFERVLTVRH